MTTPFLFVPVFQGFDNAGAPLAGGKLYTYTAGGTVNKATYSDANGLIANTNPVVLDSTGRATVRLEPGAYHFVLTDSTGTTTLWDADYYTAPYLTQSDVGDLLFPDTTAETNVGATTSNYYLPNDIRRYGIVPNSSSAASTNTSRLQSLLSPLTTGPTGTFYFPNTTGADVYYFNDIVQIRPQVTLDLMGSTINFSKTYATTDQYMGFFTFVKDVTIQNGSIVVNYTGSGTAAGCALRIGSRSGYPWGSYTAGIFDYDDLVSLGKTPQGNISIKNLRITSNNASTNMVTMLGGLENVSFENVFFEGGGAMDFALYYEYGWASKNASASTKDWSSSHMHNASFKNIRVNNLRTAGSDGGFGLTGAYNCTVENLWVQGAYTAFNYRLGEALFYRVWPDVDDSGAKRGITLRNIVGTNIANTGIKLIGAELASSGYLSTSSLTASQQTDLMSFSLDSFAIESVGAGITVSGPATISNGHIKGTNTSGGIIITDDCVQFDINNVRIEGATAAGIRGNFTGIGVWGTARLKLGQIRNCLIAGGAAEGILLNNTIGVSISNNRIGYNALYDSAGNEATQTTGISLSSLASGCEMRDNYITVSAGNAYNSAGSGDRGNNIIRPKGTATNNTPTVFLLDGVASATAAQILDKTNVINTASKYLGKICRDTTNNRYMVAQGTADVSTWIVIDGSVTVTPV